MKTIRFAGKSFLSTKLRDFSSVRFLEAILESENINGTEPQRPRAEPMFASGNTVFLQLPDAPREAFVEGAFLGRSGKNFTIRLEPGVNPTKFRDVRVIALFYDHDGRFVKQLAQPKEDDDNFDQDEESAQNRIVLEAISEPVSSERRECFRVEAHMDEVDIIFGADHQCSLVDVSAMGFGVITELSHGVGEIVEARLSWEEVEARGSVCIQSARSTPSGQFRYGVLCVQSEFQRELQRLTMEIQRKELQRRAWLA